MDRRRRTYDKWWTDGRRKGKEYDVMDQQWLMLLVCLEEKVFDTYKQMYYIIVTRRIGIFSEFILRLKCNKCFINTINLR